MSYEKFISSGITRYAISSIDVDRETLTKKGPWQDVYQSTDLREKNGIAAGGKLLLAGDSLYFSVGDYDDITTFAAQRPESPFGKVFEMDLPTHKIRMRSMGHRNQQGLALLRDGGLVEVEQGPQGATGLR